MASVVVEQRCTLVRRGPDLGKLANKPPLEISYAPPDHHCHRSRTRRQSRPRQSQWPQALALITSKLIKDLISRLRSERIGESDIAIWIGRRRRCNRCLLGFRQSRPTAGDLGDLRRSFDNRIGSVSLARTMPIRVFRPSRSASVGRTGSGHLTQRRKCRCAMSEQRPSGAPRWPSCLLGLATAAEPGSRPKPVALTKCRQVLRLPQARRGY